MKASAILGEETWNVFLRTLRIPAPTLAQKNNMEALETLLILLRARVCCLGAKNKCLLQCSQGEHFAYIDMSHVCRIQHRSHEPHLATKPLKYG